MSNPIKAEEYILNMSMIQPDRNYLKQGEKAGDATTEKEYKEYIKSIFEEGLNITVNSTKIEYRNGNLIRDGKKVEVSDIRKETIMEYVARKAEDRAQKDR